uniref:Uncharacterized protein n=1 Tax=Arundo donax TaxID=35708 RepID=A0A0A8ZUA8_ARUDO
MEYDQKLVYPMVIAKCLGSQKSNL